MSKHTPITVELLSTFNPAFKWTELFGAHSTRNNKVTWNVAENAITRTQDAKQASLIQCFYTGNPIGLMHAMDAAAKALNDFLVARENQQ